MVRDEGIKLHEIERKIRDKQFYEKAMTDRLKNEYDELRGRFEQMAYELRFSIEDELRIYARLLDELMKKSSSVNFSTTLTSQPAGSLTSTLIRSIGIEDLTLSTTSQWTNTGFSTGASNILDLASNHGEWSQPINLNESTENLLKINENDIQETYEGSSIIRSSSYSILD